MNSVWPLDLLPWLLHWIRNDGSITHLLLTAKWTPSHSYQAPQGRSIASAKGTGQQVSVLTKDGWCHHLPLTISRWQICGRTSLSTRTLRKWLLSPPSLGSLLLQTLGVWHHNPLIGGINDESLSRKSLGVNQPERGVLDFTENMAASGDTWKNRFHLAPDLHDFCTITDKTFSHFVKW